MNKIGKALIEKILFYFTLATILLLPKITIIEVPGNSVGIRLEDFLIVVLLALVIIDKIKNRERTKKDDTKKKKIIRWFAIYFAISVVSTIIGAVVERYSPINGALFCLRSLEYFSFFFVGIWFAKKYKAEKKIFNFILICVAIDVAIAVLQYLGVVGMLRHGTYIVGEKRRACAMFNGPYEFACFLSMVAPACLYYFFYKRRALLYGLAYVLCIVGVILSQSRSSLAVVIFISALITLGFFVHLSKHKTQRKIIARNVIFVLLVSALSLVSIETLDIDNRFESLSYDAFISDTQYAFEDADYESFINSNSGSSADTEGDVSYNMRIRKWASLLECFKQSPVVGCGSGSATTAVDGNYVRLLVESGALGTIAWMGFIISIMKGSKKRSNESYLIVKYGTIAIILTAIFIDVFAASKIMMFYYLIVGYDVESHKDELNSERDKELS